MTVTNYPIHLALLVSNVLTTLATMFLGAWFLSVHSRAAQVEERLQADKSQLSEEDLENLHPVDRLKSAGAALGALCCLFTLYLVKQTFDLVVVLFGSAESVGGYRDHLAYYYQRCIASVLGRTQSQVIGVDLANMEEAETTTTTRIQMTRYRSDSDNQRKFNARY